MRKPTLTLGTANKLAELLAAAPAKPVTERPVDLDAVIERLWPILAKKMREDGWTRSDCAEFLVAHDIDRSVADIKRSIGRFQSSQTKKKAGSVAPERADRSRKSAPGGVHTVVTGETPVQNGRRHAAALSSGRRISGDDI